MENKEGGVQHRYISVATPWGFYFFFFKFSKMKKKFLWRVCSLMKGVYSVLTRPIFLAQAILKQKKKTLKTKTKQNDKQQNNIFYNLPSPLPLSPHTIFTTPLSSGVCTPLLQHPHPHTMSYIEELNRLPAFTGSGEFTLDPMLRVLSCVGEPHLKLPPVIHVTGTNGKGSVVAHACELLEEVGLRTAAFTSPHSSPQYLKHLTVGLAPVEEKVFSDAVLAVVNAKEVSTEEDAEHLAYLKELNAVVQGKHTEQAASQFECITAASLLAVSRLHTEGNVDVLVLEVGLGGRVDCTNVIPAPAVAVFTSIDKDHCGILGDTPEKIALEKSGIIKPNTKAVVTYPQYPEVERCLRKVAASCRVPEGSFVSVGESGQNDTNVASHRIQNFLLAREACLHLITSPRITLPNKPAILNTLRTTPYRPLSSSNTLSSGRFEVWHNQTPPFEVIFDGAHNPQAVKGLADTLERHVGEVEGEEGEREKACVVVLGVLKDKDTAALAETYRGFFGGGAVFCPVTMPPPRGLQASELAQSLLKAGVPQSNLVLGKESGSVPEALKTAVQIAKTRVASCPSRHRATLLVTGSFYLLSSASDILANLMPGLERVQ